MPVRHYRALLESAGNGSWGVIFPELPGCVSHGDDADQAARTAAESLALHLEGLAEDGEPIPDAAPLDAPLPDWLAGEAPIACSVSLSRSSCRGGRGG